MSKKYTYTITLDTEEWPRYIADQMTMRPWFARHLVSVTDNQRNDHWYGDHGKTQSATYHVSRDEQASGDRVLKHLEDETPDVW